MEPHNKEQPFLIICILCIIISSSEANQKLSATQLDDTSGVNPITPGNTTPGVNPINPGNTTPGVNPINPGNTTPGVNPAAGQQQPGGITSPTSGKAWCIASPSASQTALQVALDYACGYGGTDCSEIQSGASCYNPNTVKDHASYAFNDYYQKNPVQTSCDFGGTAELTYNDPSSGNCHYASSSASQPPPTGLTPPASMTMPMSPPTPTGSTIYGSEAPSELPNSALTISQISFLCKFGSCMLLALMLKKYI